MSDEFKGELVMTEVKEGKLYTKGEVKTKKTISLIEGIVLGAIGLLTTGVIVSKVSNVNLIDSANDVVDLGISKVKSLPGKIRKGKDSGCENGNCAISYEDDK
jgi:hypothetical protein